MLGAGDDVFLRAPKAGAGPPPPPLARKQFTTAAGTSVGSLTLAGFDCGLDATPAYGILICDATVVDILSTGDDITGVTYGGVAMTALDLVFASIAKSRLYYLLNPPAGANDLVVTASGLVALGIGARALQGVNQTGTFGTVAKAAATSTAMQVTVPGVTSGNYVLEWGAAFIGTNTTSATAGGSQVDLENTIVAPSPNRTRALSSLIVSGSGSLTPAYTLAVAKAWAHAGVELKAA